MSSNDKKIFSFLFFLAGYKWLGSIKELAELLDLKYPSIIHNVQRLERLDLIERDRGQNNPKLRRTRSLRLTERGIAEGKALYR